MKQAQLQLDVPFAAKDQAKSLGARWDPQQRSWYVPQGVDIQRFQAWWPEALKAQAGAALQPPGKAAAAPSRKPAAARVRSDAAAIFTGPPEVAPDHSGKLPWED
ncbi:DUF5710 domain-containing protein [Comamonas antarctica]|uniref:DUF5710 domain-containing protein n=1 Tax=Comamonas antarctica TaxID=2743470 RepID=A0A6N1X8G4_9BURK|nr:DUF5710 domain-containing protein [Comamonas antarctica]QKV55128.1 hypothetical protein HUK68_19465 [Comamonas antarctica]